MLVISTLLMVESCIMNIIVTEFITQHVRLYVYLMLIPYIFI